jgi:hypothetical protein
MAILIYLIYLRYEDGIVHATGIRTGGIHDFSCCARERRLALLAFCCYMVSALWERLSVEGPLCCWRLGLLVEREGAILPGRAKTGTAKRGTCVDAILNRIMEALNPKLCPSL